MNTDAQDANDRARHHRLWNFSGTPVSDDELEARFTALRDDFQYLKISFNEVIERVATLNQKLQKLRDEYQAHVYYHDPDEPGE
jgi:uncharacterized small protein (DUF1192 family)